MTTTAWAHLPNAQHIDRILAHLEAHPKRWDAARDAAKDAARGAALGAARSTASGAARDSARDAARVAAWGAARDAAWDAARDAAWDAAWDAARDAALALVAYDDCAHYLNLSSGAVKVAVSAGISAAVLLYPAVLAMENT